MFQIESKWINSKPRTVSFNSVWNFAFFYRTVVKCEKLFPGPDEVLPSTVYTTTDISKPVKIRFGENEVGKLPPVSVPTILARAAAECPDKIALGYKKHPNEKEFHTITYKYVKNLLYCA